jgi:hypothetical protein
MAGSRANCGALGLSAGGLASGYGEGRHRTCPGPTNAFSTYL